ncbi:hypothetical protein ACIPY2_14655 [Paenarthrobacter sp. NPDC089675]|uniref:hypothetical protein n=1 Tax=Paenarthrobacter sp. NPDC089675 TaxID=3364376 RepID=UPI0037F2D62E
MSNPPYPPSNPGDSTPEQQGSQSSTPQYGQPSAPQYGQQSQPQAPQYGQPAAPQYGQSAPQYGQQAPQYGQQASPYGQSAPQYGQQAPQYGQDTNWPSQQPGPSRVPQLVNISFWMILAAGVLTLIGIPLTIALLNSSEGQAMIQQALDGQGSRSSDISVSSIVGVAITFVVIISLIMAGLYALVAFKVRQGKNWARILGTVLAAISLLGLSQIGVGTITILLGVAAIVLLYLPASAPYFRKQQAFGNPYQNPYNGR